MASQTLKHRPKEEPTTTATTTATHTTCSHKYRKDQKLAMAKRGLRSLAVAVAIPAFGTAASISIAGATLVATRPSWSPPVWTFHLGSLLMSALLGFSSWLVWAEGGFHGRSEALPLYLLELLLSLLWAPLVFSAGFPRPGMAVCAAHFAVLFMLSQSYRQVNPIAADLIKPYLAWVSFLVVFNYKLL
ncbi:hypothetical protein B296_00031234 [Ensete ventricosum]|uniref:Peripheral-type benzodiazepine receptor n=1 Tax=Ensete ventricosum TaxID=4639 RepID=A0A427AGU0_ENSVE|nr:hypothetical protein B296_00031234 [Ensete ventricosum]